MALPQGFSVGTADAGFRNPRRQDVAILISDRPCVAAGVFTTNVFKAAPVLECQRILQSNVPPRAVLVNSGQANACTGSVGLKNCRMTTQLMAEALNMDMTEKDATHTASALSADTILPLSTGVIGDHLKMELWPEAVMLLKKSLESDACTEEHFTRAMMTTDAFPKFVQRDVTFSGGTVRFAAMCKGAGMICPNMATMLAIIVCDAMIDAHIWTKLFERAVEKTFNRVTVDGDTSTNDTVLGLANGASDVRLNEDNEGDMALLDSVLQDMLGKLAYMLVQDGEGATKVLHIEVYGARTDADAEKVARTVGHSQLVKTAMYGRDANWGRIVGAVGRSGVDMCADHVRISLCGVELFANGTPTDCDHDALLKAPLMERDIFISIEMGQGEGRYVLLASDLSHDYVSCNADYRT